MIKSMTKLALAGLLAIAMAATAVEVQAQEKPEKPEKPETPRGSERGARGLPLNGKIASVNQSAKTVTIGKTTIQINSDTRITKAGKPATLEDAKVGEQAAAFYRKSDDGKLLAASLRIGPRPEGEAAPRERRREN